MRPSEALDRHRDAILEVLGRYPVADARLFGSTARGEDREGSDLDLLVRITGSMGYFELFRLQDDLEAVSGVRCDVRTEEEFLESSLRRVRNDSRPL